MSSSWGTQATILAVGTETTVTIRAHRYWNDTNLRVMAGETYVYRASGRWFDFGIPSGPDGYETPAWSLLQRLLQDRRRLTEVRWFVLCGAIVSGVDAYLFPIGAQAELKAPVGGLLRCFANDVPCFYWNNFGSVNLVIERVS